MSRAEKYRCVPNGFLSLLNKMLKATLTSRPLRAVPFFADYLEAEMNRRILCEIQLTQACPSDVVRPTDPWVQFMAFMTLQGAVESLVMEENPSPKTDGGGASSFDGERAENKSNKKKKRTKEADIPIYLQTSHKPFRWPPVIKQMPKCRRKFDRYGPIAEPITISSRIIRRYIRDDPIEVIDRCKDRKPITNYWRMILDDCSELAKRWNRKTEHPRRQLRSDLERREPNRAEEDIGEDSESFSDLYEEPKKRMKGRNDEGLAKIIYRELGTLPAPVQPPSEEEEEKPVRPGKANKMVQVEFVASVLPRYEQPKEAEFHVDVLDKAVQVDLDEKEVVDFNAWYALSDEMDELEDTCPPNPIFRPLPIDWKELCSGSPWPDSHVDWMEEMAQEIAAPVKVEEEPVKCEDRQEPEKTEEKREPEKPEERREPEKTEEIREPEEPEEKRGPEKPEERREPEKTEEIREPEVEKEPVKEYEHRDESKEFGDGPHLEEPEERKEPEEKKSEERAEVKEPEERKEPEEKEPEKKKSEERREPVEPEIVHDFVVLPEVISVDDADKRVVDAEDPAKIAEADTVAARMDMEGDHPAGQLPSDTPAEPLRPRDERPAALMEGDEEDDPYSDVLPEVVRAILSAILIEQIVNDVSAMNFSERPEQEDEREAQKEEKSEESRVLEERKEPQEPETIPNFVVFPEIVLVEEPEEEEPVEKRIPEERKEQEKRESVPVPNFVVFPEIVVVDDDAAKEHLVTEEEPAKMDEQDTPRNP